MNPDIYNGDPSLKEPILISGIPLEPETASFYTGTLNAGSQFTILWETIPDKPQLSLWNFQISIRFGTNDQDHVFPNGGSLTFNQATVSVSVFTDVTESNAYINRPVTKVIMKNDSGDSFDFFMFFKSYTFATSIGAITT